MPSQLILLSAISMINMAWCEQNSHGPEIILERTQVLLMNGEVVIEKKYGGADYREADKMFKELRAGGLKKGHRIVMRKLERPRLKFMDVNGHSKKEFELGTEVVVSTEGATGLSGSVKMRHTVSRQAALSPERQRAVVIETRGRVSLSEEDGDGAEGETATLQQYDADGNLVWEKTLANGRIANACKVSALGRRTFCLESWSFGGNPQTAIEPPLVVRDSRGKDIFSFPGKTSLPYALHMEDNAIKVSPNGRFVGLSVMKEKSELILFIDIDLGKDWEMELPGFVIDITDEGIARVGHLSGATTETVDIAIHLK